MKQYALARPYAKAAFLFAKEQDQTTAWSEFLNDIAQLFQDTVLTAFLKHPKFNAQDFIDAIMQKQNQKNNSGFANFLKLLAENQRLTLLPEIAELFLLDVKAENTVREVQIKSAMPLSKTEIKHLTTDLEQKFAQPVELSFTVDPSLIGGLMIESGDYVIDGSLKGQLQRLKTTLL